MRNGVPSVIRRRHKINESPENERRDQNANETRAPAHDDYGAVATEFVEWREQRAAADDDLVIALPRPETQNGERVASRTVMKRPSLNSF